MNLATIHYLNVFLGFSAILLQIISVALLLILFLGKGKNTFLSFIQKHFLAIGLFISLSAVFFSLIYSEVIGFAPCQLCWLQRIFLFPQVFLLGVAFWTKDKKVIKYSLPLLCVGFFIAVYHSFIYYFAATSNFCGVNSISCVQRVVDEFGGYISIPTLSLTSFFALLVLVLVAHFHNKD